MKLNISSAPGTVLKEKFIDKYQLNPSQLAKALGLSQSAVRNITINKAKITLPIALRLAKYFQTKENYWIDLQNAYDLAALKEDKKFAAVLGKVKTAQMPEKKAETKKADAKKAPAVKAKKARKPVAAAAKEKKGRKPSVKKGAAKKTSELINLD
ncbi:MAG: HigA family addiction module antidote protein [Treponema sp.]|nr:HigA family addiction module antidote protein [Treponema sp.]